MVTALEQLALPFSQAMNNALQDAFKAGVGILPTDLNARVNVPEQVILTVTPTAEQKPGWVYYGNALASYERVDLGSLLGEDVFDLKVKVTSPVSLGMVADQVAEMVGLTGVFGHANVANTQIAQVTNGKAVKLTALPTDKRYKGYRTVLLYTTLIGENP